MTLFRNVNGENVAIPPEEEAAVLAGWAAAAAAGPPIPGEIPKLNAMLQLARLGKLADYRQWRDAQAPAVRMVIRTAQQFSYGHPLLTAAAAALNLDKAAFFRAAAAIDTTAIQDIIAPGDQTDDVAVDALAARVSTLEGGAATTATTVASLASGKASQTALDALSSTVGNKAAQTDLAALATRVAALEAKAPQKAIVTTNNNGTYTWTYPVAFGTGIVPNIKCDVVAPSGATVPYTVNIVGDPTNAQVSIKVWKQQTFQVSILGATVIPFVDPGAGIKVHITAEPPA